MSVLITKFSFKESLALTETPTVGCGRRIGVWLVGIPLEFQWKSLIGIPTEIINWNSIGIPVEIIHWNPNGSH